MMKICSHTNAKQKKKNAEGFQVSDIYWSFTSSILAVKGLKRAKVVVSYQMVFGLMKQYFLRLAILVNVATGSIHRNHKIQMHKRFKLIKKKA